MCVCMYGCVCVCVCLCVYRYVYIGFIVLSFYYLPYTVRFGIRPRDAMGLATKPHAALRPPVC